LILRSKIKKIRPLIGKKKLDLHRFTPLKIFRLVEKASGPSFGGLRRQIIFFRGCVKSIPPTSTTKEKHEVV
jgi:hypothetical protein